MLNSRDISLLRDDVEVNCRKWIERCKAAGLNVLVTQTVRDKEYQASLYAQGRTKPGKIVTNAKVPTFHASGVGLAFDFCKNVKGQEYSDAAFFHKAAAIALVARQAEICLVSDLGEDFVRSLYLTPFGSLDAALSYAFGKYGEDARVTVMPYAGSTLPAYVGE